MAVDESPAAGMSPEMQAAFEQLRQGFVAGLAQRWQEIDTATEGEQRRAALHRLVGAAGSYGFHQLGAAARAAEVCQKNGDEPGLAQALLALREQLQACGVTVP